MRVSRRLVLALAILILLGALGIVGLRAWQCTSTTTALADQAAQLRDFLGTYGASALTSPDSIASVRRWLQVMDAEAGRLRADAAPFLALSPHLSALPGWGPDLKAAPQLLDMAQGLLDGAELLAGVAQTTFEGATPGNERSPSHLLRILQASADRLALAGAALDRAAAARSQIDAARLSAGLRAQLADYDRLAPLLSAGLRAARLAPLLLGLDRPQVYLVLAQSEDELRPTGGFITAAGYLRIENGRVTDLSLTDSYQFDDLSKDYPYPPWPLQEYMAADMWLLRDSNWSPDFPTAAETAAALARWGIGQDVDGVIAIDQRVLQYLLAAVGPVDVAGRERDGSPERVSADNLTEWMQQRWAPETKETQDQRWWLQRKAFVADLAGALRDKLESWKPDGPDGAALGKALLQALAEKHLLVYSRDPRAVELLAGKQSQTGWDGRIARGPGDYLMVVEANVGFNKASPLIDRRLTQRVSLDSDGGAREDVTVTYQHRGARAVDFCDHTPRYDPIYTDQMNRCYWNYVRLVAPASADIETAPGIQVPAENLVTNRPSRDTVDRTREVEGRDSWGELALLQPGQHLDMHYVYFVPAAAAPLADGRRRYRLTLQKQPGLADLPASLEIALPPGAHLLHAIPQPKSVERGTLTYTLDLVQDQTIVIDYGS